MFKKLAGKARDSVTPGEEAPPRKQATSAKTLLKALHE